MVLIIKLWYQKDIIRIWCQPQRLPKDVPVNLPLIIANPPAPMNHVKYVRAGPGRNTFSNLVRRQYKSFPYDRFQSIGNLAYNYVEE